MKKLISVTLAICVALTSLFTGIYAMADSKVTSSDVKTKINESAIYLMSVKKAGFTVDNAGSLNSFIRAGVNMSDYKAEFAKSVKENLDSNGGKIQSTVGYDANNNWAPIKGESAGVYANVILALDGLGYSAKSFEGYNIVSAFENVKLVKDNENQYLFSSIFTVANKYGLKDYLKKAQNFLVNNYYEFGTGSTYYTSTDSTSQFVIAVAPYAGYQSFVDDALASIENFKKDGGYLYNFDNTYGEPKVNADSTALALAAYSPQIILIRHRRFTPSFLHLNVKTQRVLTITKLSIKAKTQLQRQMHSQVLCISMMHSRLKRLMMQQPPLPPLQQQSRQLRRLQHTLRTAAM